MKLNKIYITDRLRELMGKRGLTQTEFGKRAGITYYSVNNILKGINVPRLDTLIDIANAFNVSLDWLCSEGDKTK